MPQLNPFPTARQAAANSCWACAGRMINNWYQAQGESGANGAYATDQAFANAWNAASPGHNHNNIDIQQSAAGALADLGYDNVIDQRALPLVNEIRDEIAAGRPLLAIVAGVAPNPNPNPAAQNGHWVVIIGINGGAGNEMLDVFDPNDGLIHTVAYDAATYLPGQYWQNTSYVDPQ